jgi:streptogramin lyase
MLLAILVLAAAVAPAPPAVHAVQIQDSPVAVTIAPRPGTSRLVCHVDTGPARACTRFASFRLSPGRHSISVRAVVGGRTSAPRSVSVVVPAPAPTAVAVGGRPVGIAAAGNSVWVSGGTSGQVVRIDASTHRVVARVEAGGAQLGGAAATADAAWVADFGGGKLIRIDAASNSVTDRIAVGGQPTGVAADGAGSVWVANLNGYVTRVDAASGAITAKIALPSGASMPLPARGRIWVGLQDGSLAAIDPATNRLTGTPVHISTDVDSIADTPAGLWMTTFDGRVALVDPATDAVVRRLTLPGRGSGVSYAGGSVWASVYDNRYVVRLDPATGALLGAVHTGLSPRESVVAGGALWVLDEAGAAVTPIPLS